MIYARILLASTLFSPAVLLFAQKSYILPGSATKQQVDSHSSNAELASPEIERQVNELLGKMTLEEKLGQLVQYNDQGITAPTAANGESEKAIALNPTANYKLNPLELAAAGRMGSMLNVIGKEKTERFQRAAVQKSRLHIPLLFGADVIHGYRTVYPVPLGLGATWDPALVEKLCAMSAAEASTAGVRWFYSPMVDISRDARWGRVTEGAGEDPYLGSAMARAYIRGYQGKTLKDPEHVAASVKHFAAYGAAEAGREYYTTDMSNSRLHQIYLPPYKAAVEEGAATIMSAFNSLNGVPATANHYLMTTLLRDTWGFNGAVVSDYTAVMELTHHGIALTPAIASEKAITAGVDVDMMSHYYDAELPALIKSGKVSMSVIDEAVRRVLRVKYALGLFDHPYGTATEVTAAVPEHRPLVRQAAEESFVLLKNSNDILPLAAHASKIALIGPLADDPSDMQGAWGGATLDRDVVTLKRAMEGRAAKNGTALLYAKGTDIEALNEDGFGAAEQVAKSADVIVMALGESAGMSGEAGSRAYLNLPGNQGKLLKQIVALGKPTVLLVFSGRPLALKWEAEHVDAIMEAWFPGTEAGNALADILYGDVSPSGKLPMSFPYTVGQEPLYYAQFPTGRPPYSANLNVPPTGDSKFISRYIDAPNAALFPFGFGLGYTSFSFSDVKISRTSIPLAEAKKASHDVLVTITASVTNTGQHEGTETVQCYVRNQGTSLEQPVRALKGFQRVTLKPGETRTVKFPLSYDELSFWTNEGITTIEPTDYTAFVGGDSNAKESIEFHIKQ